MSSPHEQKTTIGELMSPRSIRAPSRMRIWPEARLSPTNRFSAIHCISPMFNNTGPPRQVSNSRKRSRSVSGGWGAALLLKINFRDNHFEKIRSRVMVSLVAGSRRACRAEGSDRFKPSRGRVDTLENGEGREDLSSRHGLGLAPRLLGFETGIGSERTPMPGRLKQSPVRLPVLVPVREDDPGA